MKVILSALIATVATLTANNVQAYSTNKHVTINLQRFKGLTMSENCEGALTTGFLVAFNVIGSKLDKPFAAMNLLSKELYFEYDNDDLADLSSGYIKATFEASCDACDYNDDEPPVMLFKDADTYLADSAAHAAIEKEMLVQLKNNKMCPSFAALETVKIDYNTNDRRALLDNNNDIIADVDTGVDDIDTNKDESVAFQQAVTIAMDHVDATLVDTQHCKAALNEAFLSTVQTIYTDSGDALTASYLQAFNVDSSNFFPTKARHTGAAIDQPTDDNSSNTHSNNNLRANPKSNIVVGVDENKTKADFTKGRYNGHMDLMLPTDLDFASLLHFQNTKHSFRMAARHHHLEQALQDALQTSDSCDAFHKVSDIEISFHGKHVPVESPTLESEQVTDYEQPMEISLNDVDGSRMTGSCMAIYEKAFVTAYNRAHPEEDTMTALGMRTHSIDAIPIGNGDGFHLVGTDSEKEDSDGLESRGPLQFYLWHFHYKYRGIAVGRCYYCSIDEDPRWGRKLVESGSNVSFEVELMNGLKESDCAAFHSITSVTVHYIDSLSSSGDLTVV